MVEAKQGKSIVRSTSEVSSLEQFQRSYTLQGVRNDLRRVTAQIEERRVFETAALLGGLLTVPSLQSACFRLEALTHIAVATCRGPRIPKIKQISPWYEALGRGKCRTYEDPPEEVFVGLADSGQTTYRLFEGIWEGNSAYVSIFLRVLAGMPETEPYISLRRQTAALLCLSDLVAARSRLRRYAAGSPARPHSIPSSLFDCSDEIRARICFSLDDLEAAHIDLDDLAPFVFDMSNAPSLVNRSVGHTELERAPLLADEGGLALVLPTAVGAAVRRHVIETMVAAGMTGSLSYAIAQAHGAVIADTPLFGEQRGMPTLFSRRGSFPMAESELQIDDGHVLHFIVVGDHFDNYAERGLAGFNSSPELSSRVQEAVNRCSSQHSTRAGFKQGVSIVIMCGWGRGFSYNIARPKANWRVQALPAHDVVTLSMTEGMKARRLFAMLKAEADLEELGVHLINANGLLALAAWAHALGGHLVPHEKIHSSDDELQHQLLIQVDQDELRNMRVQVAQCWDRHRIPDIAGREMLVMRESPYSPPLGKKLAPLYASLDDVADGRLRAVAETERHAWWLSIETPRSANRDLIYNLWLAVARWVERLVPILEVSLPDLHDGPYQWHVTFADTELGHDDDPDQPYEDLIGLISIEVDPTARLMTISCDKGFVGGVRSAENIAERSLVRGLIDSVHRLCGRTLSGDQLEAAVDAVMPDKLARSMHGFRAQTFHDHVRHAISEPVFIDRFDDAASRINLGWLARSKTEGATINGVSECCSYLDHLVDGIWERLKARIVALNRADAIRTLLVNHEAAYVDAQHWRRTFFAVRSLSTDVQFATRTAAERLARLSAADLACRLLVEICNCEAPETGGLPLGSVELGTLMADVMLLHYMGGYRDAIRFGAMEPTVKISPAGEVMMNHELSNAVVSPLGYTHQSNSLAEGASGFRRMYRRPQNASSSKDHLDPVFLAVWQGEFGASFDEYRIFVDAIEDLGVRCGKAVMTLPRSQLLAEIAASHKLPAGPAEAILERLTLHPRPCWHKSPPGFAGTAWHPWRFGRQLSLLSRPLVRTGTSADPEYMVTPGLVRLSLVYLLGGSLEGMLDNKYFTTSAMRSWIGRTTERQGREFNELVEQEFQKLGWQSRSNLKLDAILNMKLPVDYGDVDVLAWREGDSRVLCIECKRLLRDMTVGQIAERLAEYRGGDDEKDRPDRLKRHLQRMAVLEQHKAKLAKFVKRSDPVTLQSVMIFDDHTPMSFRPSPAMKGMVIARVQDLPSLFA